eukprot:Gb_12064 [translate_table: standard]
MHPGDRGDGRRRGMGGFGGSFGGFPNFPDPFGGFGMFGGGGGRSLIEEFFGHDPFEDPFFRRPFGGMFGPPGGLFNSGSILGSNRSMGILDDGPFGHSSNDFFIDQRPFNPPQSETRRGPIIEELPDDHEAPASDSMRNQQEPIVEHPDDETSPGDTEQHPINVTQQYQRPQSRPQHTSQSFSYQSSTFSGPGGAYYSSSSKRRANSNGVVEEEHHEKDSSAGTENINVARAIGDKMHAISRKRNAEGRENTLETLHNLTEEEVVKFNETWERQADSSLPGSRNRSHMLEGNHGGSSSRSQRRLPSTEGRSHASPGVRRS